MDHPSRDSLSPGPQSLEGPSGRAALLRSLLPCQLPGGSFPRTLSLMDGQVLSVQCPHLAFASRVELQCTGQATDGEVMLHRPLLNRSTRTQSLVEIAQRHWYWPTWPPSTQRRFAWQIRPLVGIEPETQVAVDAKSRALDHLAQVN